MRFLRTASTRHLLAVIAAVVGVIAAGTAIAVAATSSGPVPRAQPLAKSIHSALSAKPVAGLSGHFTFTNNLISSTDFTGGAKDPLLQGASGRFWWSPKTGLRLELQTDNGDGELVVTHKTFWFSDPASQTVYEGTLPADTASSGAKHKKASEAKAHGIPSVASLQSDITKLMGHVLLRGSRTSDPKDIGGQPAYSVSISPKHSAGLLGSAQLAWDAATGTPLDIAVNAKGATTNPVLELKVTGITFGAVQASDITIPVPSGDKVVRIATPAGSAAGTGSAGKGTAAHGAKGKHAHKQVSGVRAVAKQVPFTLTAPGHLVGLPRHTTSLLDWGGSPAALVTYGENLGGLAVIEQKADGSSPAGQPASPSGKLALPTVSINGATGTELGTALGTVLRYTKGGVSYTLIGSVLPSAAEQAARALTP